MHTTGPLTRLDHRVVDACWLDCPLLRQPGRLPCCLIVVRLLPVGSWPPLMWEGAFSSSCTLIFGRWPAGFFAQAPCAACPVVPAPVYGCFK
eukprot:UN4697